MSDIIFKIDKTTVTEGDIVEVAWACPNAQSVSLTLNNGFKSVEMPLDTIGNKKFRLNRSKGKTEFILNVALSSGKNINKSLKVKVKELKAINPEFVGSESKVWHSLKEAFYKIKVRWQALPAQKRSANIVLWVIAISLILSMINPMLLQIGLIVVIAYLALVLMKK